MLYANTLLDIGGEQHVPLASLAPPRDKILVSIS